MELFDILTLEKDVRQNIDDIDEEPTYTEIGSVENATLRTGEYLFNTAVTTRFSDTNDSVLVRATVQGVEYDFSKERKDRDDVTTFNFLRTITLDDEALNTKVEISKTSGGSQLDVVIAETLVRRVG